MKRFVALLAVGAIALAAPCAASAQRGFGPRFDEEGPRFQVPQGPPRGRNETPPQRPSQPQQQQQPQRRISEGQAIAAVARVAGPGHHLDVFYGERGGRPVFTVRWASDNGQRRDYYVDAETGALR
jgi:hypothetical protein